MKHPINTEAKTNAAPTSKRMQARGKDLDQKIYHKMYKEIAGRRIVSGTKLSEKPLCSSFNTSRSRISHLRLAQISGKHVLHNFLDELLTRTSLIMGIFSTFNNLTCTEGEHTKILEAIISKNPVKA